MKPLTLFWSDNHHNKNVGSFTTDPTDQISMTYVENSITNGDDRSDRL